MPEDTNRKSMIRVKGGYSDMAGIDPYRVDLQITEFDDRTRTKLSNVLFDILECYFDKVDFRYRYSSSVAYNDNGAHDFCKKILSEVFAERIDLQSGAVFRWRGVFENNICKVISDAPYNEVLDIVWFICNWLYTNMGPASKELYKILNNFFERETVGYRFIDGRPLNIIEDVEVNEIEEACNCKFEVCKDQIRGAVRLLADREGKDYKNSIKESISAIESACRIIIENENATLGEALKLLKSKGLDLHPALEKAFSCLYGYACDKGGIRHGEGLAESNVSFDEAKFILVSCSAFLNFLIAESDKQGLKID